MAGPTINTGHTTNIETSNTTSHTINAPTHSEGDVIYIFAATDGYTDSVTMTKPSGFTALFENATTFGDEVFGSLWYKTAGASEPSTYTWTSDVSEKSTTMAWSISNDGGIDVLSGPHTGDGDTASCAPVTSTVDETLALRLVYTNGETLSHGTASGHTKLDELEYASAASMSMQYKAYPSAGSVEQIWPYINSSEAWKGYTLVIKPASDPGINFIRSGGVTGTSFSFDIGTAGTDRLVSILAGDESQGTNLTGVTVDGKSCTLVKVANNTDGLGNHLEMWYTDEDGLGASNGSVTVSIAGGDSGWGLHAMLHTGVDQSGPQDFGFDETSVSVATITCTGVDVAADGLVVGGFCEGTGGLTESSVTSPLDQKQDGPDPSSADLFSYAGVESSTQSNKSYILTLNASHNRATGIVASWDKVADVIGQTYQMMI